MHVTVRLFAALRERAGTGRRELELPQGATAGDVFAALAIGSEPPGLAYAVNQEYAERSAVLADGDEIALIPPVSGGGEPDPLVLLGPEPIDLALLISHVSGPDAGAIATFTGTVRATARERDVLDLEYEAYGGMAEREIARIARDVVTGTGPRSAVWHRTGVVAVGEASVAIAISSAHRAAAFAACKQAIDTLKVTVPIWKKERYADGRSGSARGS
jgi:molybdopterin synthase catalytic subunit